MEAIAYPLGLHDLIFIIMYFIRKEFLRIICSHILIEHSERKLGQKFDVYMLLSWFLICLCP